MFLLCCELYIWNLSRDLRCCGGRARMSHSSWPPFYYRTPSLLPSHGVCTTHLRIGFVRVGTVKTHLLRNSTLYNKTKRLTEGQIPVVNIDIDICFNVYFMRSDSFRDRIKCKCTVGVEARQTGRDTSLQFAAVIIGDRDILCKLVIHAPRGPRGPPCLH